MAIKNKIAALLEQRRGSAVSGQEIADMLGVSRAAVWKSVKQLQDEGYRITAGRNRGYILEEETDVLSAGGIRLNFPEKYHSNPIEVYRSLTSTNTEAKAAALRGMPHGTIIAADGQTEGRGRFGKSFYSPEGTGLYMSVILKPGKPLSDCTDVTMSAAVAVSESIEEICGIKPGIKWVNDIFYGGRKISGILTEAISDFESGMAETVIVGIGVNISTKSFPEEISGLAGSLGVFAERNRLCAGITSRLLDYADSGERAVMLQKYRERSIVLGREITYVRRGIAGKGRAVEINAGGCLVVETDSGRETFRAGEISIIGGYK